MMFFDSRIFQILTNFILENVVKEKQSQLITMNAIIICSANPHNGAMNKLLDFLYNLHPSKFLEFQLAIDESDRLISLLYYMVKTCSIKNRKWTRAETIEIVTTLFNKAKI